MTRERHDLAVTGMSCAGCVANVERALASLPGVERAIVNLATEKATIVLDPAVAALPQLVEAVRRAGYGLVHPEPGVADGLERARVTERAAAKRQFAIASIFGIPVLVLGMSHRELGIPGERWIQLAMTSVVLTSTRGAGFTMAVLVARPA